LGSARLQCIAGWIFSGAKQEEGLGRALAGRACCREPFIFDACAF
jgi:hypothetical protein